MISTEKVLSGDAIRDEHLLNLVREDYMHFNTLNSFLHRLKFIPMNQKAIHRDIYHIMRGLSKDDVKYFEEHKNLIKSYLKIERDKN